MRHYLFAYVFTWSSSVSKKDQNYQATKLHFEDLVKRYGNPIIILNLIKVVFLLWRSLFYFSHFINCLISSISIFLVFYNRKVLISSVFFNLVRFLSNWYCYYLTNSHMRGSLASPFFVLSLVMPSISLTKIYQRRTNWGFFIGILNIFRG